jgi:hypothetical protein
MPYTQIVRLVDRGYTEEGEEKEEVCHTGVAGEKQSTHRHRHRYIYI